MLRCIIAHTHGSRDRPGRPGSARESEHYTSPSPGRLEQAWVYEFLTARCSTAVTGPARILTGVTGRHFTSAAHLASSNGITTVTADLEYPSRVSVRADAATRSSNPLGPSEPQRDSSSSLLGVSAITNELWANRITSRCWPGLRGPIVLSATLPDRNL